MAHAIRMPKPGQMTEECTLILWRKAEGEPVARGDVVFEIETDKSAMEVEAWDEGVLLRQVVEAGATVPVNAVCAWIGEPGEAIPTEEDGPTAAEPREPATDPAASGLPAAAASPAATLVTAAAASPAAASSAPVAPGTGVARGTAAASSAAGPADTAAPPDRAPGRLRISPRASRTALAEGIDPRSVAGSGPGGRITERDVRRALTERGSLESPRREAAHGEPAGAPPQGRGRPGTAEGGPRRQDQPDGTPEPMTRLRRVIADRLTESWTTTPHFTVTVAVNVQRLFDLRSALDAAGQHLSVTDVILHAAAQTLVEFPDLNSSTDGASVVRHPRVHLGLAVSVPGGLLVPVIRDADLLSVSGLHERSRALIEGARAGTLGPDALRGSTFTVSNLGMFGVEEFSAIINPGEGAILAVASAIPTPIAIGDGIAVRPVMRLTLSADHRVVDGETGARFLGALRRRLEDGQAYRAMTLGD